MNLSPSPKENFPIKIFKLIEKYANFCNNIENLFRKKRNAIYRDKFFRFPTGYDIFNSSNIEHTLQIIHLVGTLEVSTLQIIHLIGTLEVSFPSYYSSDTIYIQKRYLLERKKR